MTSNQKIDAIVAELNVLINTLDDTSTTVSYQKVLEKTSLITLVEGVLCSENGALIPGAVGLMKKRGYDFVTVKRSDAPGNALVCIKVDDTLVCVYYSMGLLELIDNAFPDTEMAPVDNSLSFCERVTHAILKMLGKA